MGESLPGRQCTVTMEEKEQHEDKCSHEVRKLEQFVTPVPAHESAAKFPIEVRAMMAMFH